MLVKMIRPKNILEVGTFSGYSALCMAEGLDDGGKVYTIASGSRLEKIPYKDILYITREGKNAEIFTEGDSAKVRKSLGAVYDELASEEFIFTDRGCIVNIIHVMQVKDGEAVLKNGLRLPISRSHLQDVKTKINTYWGAHI